MGLCMSQRMESVLQKLRKSKGWNQSKLADEINIILDRHPEYKKITKKNPDGHIDQQTAQRLESGGIALDERWLAVLGILFDVTPNVLLGVEEPEVSDAARKMDAFRNRLEEKRQQEWDAMMEIFMNNFSGKE